MNASQKRLNEMNRLSDMGHFPVVVNAGASINVVLTIAITWWIEPRYPALAGAWVALVLALNLLPVALLRLTIKPTTVYPRLAEMDFFSASSPTGSTSQPPQTWPSGFCSRGRPPRCTGQMLCATAFS
jgi:hypothetical protein